MGYARPYGSPYYSAVGGGATAGVPWEWDVSLAGRGYMLDTRMSVYTASNPNWEISTVPLVRGQADSSKRPGESSINPEDLWRRSAETWTGGAGQEFYDRDFSVDGRFRRSKGIDCWTRGRISLLPATSRALASTNTNVRVAAAGGYLYALDGTTLRYTTDVTVTTPTWTTVTPAAATLSGATSIASDGNVIWVGDVNNVYATTRGDATYGPWMSGALPASLVRYVKGRLIAANGRAVVNLPAVTGAAVPAAFYTQPNPDWTWVDISEGPNAIYAAGYSGDKSLIYRCAPRQDGAILDVPIVAGELPDGEVVRAVQGYLGFLLVGSDLGWRFATLDGSGNISAFGDLVSVASGVRCFEPQDRFVWFGWPNYDATSTGLGRIDLRTINGSTPAYATDLQATGQGIPLSVVTFANRRVFSVAGTGVWAQASSLVDAGTIDSGYVGYGLADPKTAVKVTTRHAAGAGSYAASIGVDGGPYAACGPAVTTGDGNGGAVLVAPSSARGELFEIRLTLTRSPDPTIGPTVSRWTLRSAVNAQRRVQIIVPLQLQHDLETRNGQEVHCDPTFERAQIEALAASGQITTFQEGGTTRAVIVQDFRWLPHAPRDDPHHDWGGTCIVDLRTV